MANEMNDQVLEELVMKRLKSKTYWLHILLGAAGMIQANSEMITQILGPKGTGILLMGVAIIGFVLRELTSSPVNEK